MKRITKVLTLIIVFCTAFITMSCSRVTETGNPIYENETFGVEVTYPSDWGIEESQTTDAAPGDIEPMIGGGTVCFAGGSDGTSACIHMSRLSPEPDSLIAYLQQTYPNREFTAYGTPTLSGYFYDNPDAGSDGGDLREYYFLNGNVLVLVVAEVFSGGESQLTSLLNGIKFQ